VALWAGGAQAKALGDSLIIADFESYANTDEVRADWEVLEPVLATLDLECGDASDWPVEWCGGHSTEGPASEGAHYLRINYLAGTTVARMIVNGMSDWTGWPFLRIYMRGRPYEFNGLADVQVSIIGNGGAHVLDAPLQVGATRCPPDPDYILRCKWSFFDVDLRGWPGISDVDEVRIVISEGDGDGRLYFDSVGLRTHSPIPVQNSSWGSIKAMYR
jgi:hypothetical protein